jgi:hypothetical protein
MLYTAGATVLTGLGGGNAVAFSPFSFRHEHPWKPIPTNAS